MANSSASPDHLETFVTHAGQANRDLDHGVTHATGPMQAFLDAPCDPKYRPAQLDNALRQARQYHQDNATDERWIAGIRRAFIDADSTTLPDAAIAASLAKQGISATPPPAMTVDEPVYHPPTMYSGWSDDPVSTAAGAFWHTEQDLSMPPALSILAWPRTYNSRSRAYGPQGVGWSSWATARLDATDLAVTYHGPDGQLADFLAAGDGFTSPPGVPATLRRRPDGFSLVWKWTAQYPGGRWSFDADGRLLAVDNPVGGRTDFDRDERGRLVAVRHEGGRSVALTWEGERVAALSASDGRRVRYQWDGDRLIGVRRPGGAMRYHLDDVGRVAALEDADGVVPVRNRYDEQGRVVEQVSPFGRVTRYRYLLPRTVLVEGDADEPASLFRHDEQGHLVELQVAGELRWSRQFDDQGNPVRVVSPDGTVTSRRFDVDGNCIGQHQSGTESAGLEWAWTYDRDGRVTATTGPGGAGLAFRYDSDDPVPSTVEGPLGTRVELESAGGLVRRVTDADGVEDIFERDPEGQVIAVTDGLGNTTRYAYHASGGLTSIRYPTGETQRWEYDDTGRPVAWIAPGGARTTRRYSPAGRLVEETDPEGDVTRFRIGPHGEPVSATGPDGRQLSVTWGSAGQPLALTDPTGGVWRNEWDPAGRAAAFDDATGGRWTQTWARDDLGFRLTDPLGREAHVDLDRAGRPLAAQTAGGARAELRWDDAGRLIAATTPEGRAEMRYDPLGRPTEWVVDGKPASRAVYTPAGRLAALARPDGSVWRWTYDPAGRPVGCEGPTGTERWGYDASGRLVRHEPPGGPVTEWHYGPDGTPMQVTVGGVTRRLRHDRRGQLVEQQCGPATTRWARGPGGVVGAVEDPLGGTTTFEREWRGDVTTTVDAKGARWVADRDGAGRLRGFIDPLGRHSVWELDAAGEVVGLALPDATRRRYRRDRDGALTELLITDQAGGASPLVQVSRDPAARTLVLSEEGGGQLRLRWDACQRVEECATDAGTTRWAYDDVARHVTVTRPDGTVLVERQDAAGNLIGLNHPRLGDVAIDRDGAGRITAVRADGLNRAWERDDTGRVVAYREDMGGRIREVVLRHDDLGRVVEAAGDGGTWQYAYDAAGQLVGATGPDGAWTWQYDACGRLVTEIGPAGTRRLRYDAADQILAVDGPAGTTRFVYDPLGRRVAEEGPGSSVRYEWDSMDRLVAIERTHGGEPRRIDLRHDPLGRPVRVGEQPLRWELGGPLGPVPAAIGRREVVALPGVPLAEIDEAGVRWLSADWRGSVGTRSPWGARPEPADPGGAELGFLAEVEVAGLVWLRARVYDPATHAFLTRDPLAGAAGRPGTATNPYLYAANDPLQYLDPLGLKPITVDEANQQMQDWKKGHWQIVVGAVALAGAAALVVATGGLASPLLVPALIGVGAGAAGPIVNATVQHFVYGKPFSLDPQQIFMDAAVGGLLGAAGGYVFGGVSAKVPMLGEMAVPKIANPVLFRAASIGYGAATNAGATALDTLAAGGKVTWQSEAIAAGFGAPGGMAPHLNEDVRWQDTTDLTPKQQAVVESGSRAANFYAPRVAAAKALAETRSQANLATNLNRDAGVTGLSATGGNALSGYALPETEDAAPAAPAALYPDLPKPGPPPVFPR